jgi:hypothetical protein
VLPIDNAKYLTILVRSNAKIMAKFMYPCKCSKQERMLNIRKAFSEKTFLPEMAKMARRAHTKKN